MLTSGACLDSPARRISASASAARSACARKPPVTGAAQRIDEQFAQIDGCLRVQAIDLNSLADRPHERDDGRPM
jgi:hypothetical protein